MLMRVDRWDAQKDGAISELAMRHKLQALGYEAVAREYPAGAIMSRQSDGRPRIQAVVTGLIKVTIDNEAAILSAGDLVFIPAYAVPRVEVLGPLRATCLEGVLPPPPSALL
jgi:quercetin dioxygenase-like cupin family protein